VPVTGAPFVAGLMILTPAVVVTVEFVADKATIGGTKPALWVDGYGKAELTSSAPLGVVVPMPTWACITPVKRVIK
jgi:hypothetical protein